MHRSSTRSTRRRSEAGFGLLEIIIVCVIIAILMIVMMKAFGGAKRATNINEAKTVGAAYMQAVAQYQADFANRNPTTWTASQTQGPKNLAGGYYMKSVPDQVSNGRVGLTIGCGAPAAGGTQVGWVAVCFQAEPRYYVAASGRKDPSQPWTTCYMGATTLTPKCG